jgi:hypothetical protein
MNVFLISDYDGPVVIDFEGATLEETRSGNEVSEPYRVKLSVETSTTRVRGPLSILKWGRSLGRYVSYFAAVVTVYPVPDQNLSDLNGDRRTRRRRPDKTRRDA